MRLLVIGTREDVAGFSLAGIGGIACVTREDADRAIARADADTLLIVSREFARSANRDRLSLVLPARM